MLAGLLAAARLTVPDDVPDLVIHQGRALGASAVTVYLVDHEQYLLVPLPTSAGREPLRIEATIGGLCFRRLEQQWTAANGTVTAWLPILDGLERLGVVELTFDETGKRATDRELEVFAALIAEIVLTKGDYGDLFQRVRRRQPMSLAAEIAWRLLPPLTFGTDRVVISSVLAPAYDVGGDSFD